MRERRQRTRIAYYRLSNLDFRFRFISAPDQENRGKASK